MSSSATDYDAPEGTLINLMAGIPVIGVVLTIIKQKWTSTSHDSFCDAVRSSFFGHNPQDAESVQVELHEDGGGCRVVTPSLPYSYREQALAVAAAIEQVHGPCESSAKAFGNTLLSCTQQYPTTMTNYRFFDEDREPIYVNNDFFNNDVPPTDNVTLQNRVVSTPYFNENIQGMEGCTSVNCEAVFTAVIDGSVKNATKNNGPRRTTQDFHALSQIVQSGNAGNFSGRVFR